MCVWQLLDEARELGQQEITYAVLRERAARTTIKSLQDEFTAVVKKQAKTDLSLRKKVRRMQQAKNIGRSFQASNVGADDDAPDEFAIQMSTIFKTFDADSSGYLDKAEIRNIIGEVQDTIVELLH